MASYPEDLNFALTALSGWSTNTARIMPNSLQSCDSGSFIVITLPENTLVRLDSLVLMADVVGLRGAGAADICVLPRNSYSLIDMVSVSINGTSIDASMVGYNHLAKLMDDFTDHGRKSANTPLHLAGDWDPNSVNLPQIGRTTGSAARGLTAPPSRANSDYFAGAGRNALPVAFRFEHGFLGCRKIIDTSAIGQVVITIRLAQNNVCMRPTAQTSNNPGFQLQNIRAYVDTCSLDDGVYYNVLASRIQSSPLQILFKRYLSFNAPQLTGSGSCRFSVSSQSIDAVYAMLLASNPSRDAPTAVDQTAPFFRRWATNTAGPATGYVMTTQMDLMSSQYPSFQVNKADEYYLLQNAFRSHYDKTHSSAAYLDLDRWHNDLSVFAFRFSHFTGTDFRSGVDTRGLAASAAINYVAQGALDLLPLIICETTAQINIGNFRSVSLVA